jgi:hypothetical protein
MTGYKITYEPDKNLDSCELNADGPGLGRA